MNTYKQNTDEVLLEKLKKTSKLSHVKQINLIKEAIEIKSLLVLNELKNNLECYKLSFAISFANFKEHNLLYYSVVQTNVEYFNYFFALDINKNIITDYLYPAIKSKAPVEIIVKCLESDMMGYSQFKKNIFDSFINGVVHSNSEKDRVIKQERTIPLMMKLYQNIDEGSFVLEYFSKHTNFVYSFCKSSNIKQMASVFKEISYNAKGDDLKLFNVPITAVHEARHYMIYILQDWLDKNPIKGEELLKECMLCLSENIEGKEFFNLFVEMLPEYKKQLIDGLVISDNWSVEIRKHKLEQELSNKNDDDKRKFKI